MTEGWKTDGNCETCRRQNYCNKACKLAKQRIKAMVANVFKFPEDLMQDQEMEEQFNKFKEIHQ